MRLDKVFIEDLHRAKITIIGAGGTGANVCRELVSFSKTLQELGRKPFNIWIYDNDKVEKHNVGKQLFYPSDIGYNKALILASRLNRTYGTDVTGIDAWFGVNDQLNGDIIITCVDNLNTRVIVNDKFRKGKSNGYGGSSRIYWYDLGNNKNSGQIILASNNENLKSIIEQNPNLKEDKTEASCSAYQSLLEQSFTVNRFIAMLFIHMFSELFINYKIDYNEVYFNLNKMKITKNNI